MSAEGKKRLSKEERRDQITQAALSLFSQKGFSATRTREIAQAAGISEALIFQHFKSKEDLYFAALTSLFAHHPVLDDIQEAMVQRDDEAVLYELALHFIRHTREDPRIIRLSLFSGLEGLKLHQQTQDHEHGGPGHDPLEVFTAYLAQRIKEGGIKGHDPELMARFFFCSVLMFAADRDLSILGDPPAISDQEAARAVTNIFWQGIQK